MLLIYKIVKDANNEKEYNVCIRKKHPPMNDYKQSKKIENKPSS